MIQNKIICGNCNSVNPLYALNCKNCRAFLRAKISNIDFWEITWQLFYEPTTAFIKIIQAEKKNYLILILSIILIKFTLLHFSIHQYFYKNSDNFITIYESLFWGGGVTIVAILFLSLLIYYLLKLLNVESRYLDNLSIISFSFIPLIISFLFLTPFHIALFGLYWYTLNPLPIIIKPIASYFLYSLEIIFMLWLLFLLFFATYIQSGKKLFAIISGLFIFITLFLLIIILPVL